MVGSAAGRGISGQRAGSPGSLGSTPSLPTAGSRGAWWWEPAAPGRRRGRGGGWGRGASARTSVAFIHLAAPIRLPVTHPPPPGRSLRGRALADTRAATPTQRLEVPRPGPGLGLGLQGPLSRSSGTREGTHPPSSLESRRARHRGGATLPSAAPPSSAGRVSEDAGAPGPSRTPLGCGPLGPRAGGGGGAVQAAGEGSVTQPPSARLPELCSSWSRRCYRNRKLLFPNVRAARAGRRLRLPGGPQTQPRCPEGFRPSRTSWVRAFSLPLLPAKARFLPALGGPLAKLPPNSDLEH